ncbi:uncharacterized protein N7506_007351 [Penicillium brevicompactum]|uniref:uncharacterized protein n=1 Tax=Penicillium brevicompactum TaxID=5074 RepID=UPI00253FF5AD|nr:uncharacterized protein N7506_007351 [Penicillium brevicompactum]KAJ5333568.1 hypothetical protein N7506_007351 [Penicillium brevicompactum]
MSTPRSHGDYRIGWICALPLEMAAARLFLDNIHPSLSQPSYDNNSYVLGEINGHNVVVACLPAGIYGTVSAAVVGANMISTYQRIRFGLLVGIGGGVPSPSFDVRLGDIVVSRPTGTSPGVVQYDFGKTLQSGKIERTGSLNNAHPALLTALANLEGYHLTARPRFHTLLPDTLSRISGEDHGLVFQYPGHERDTLFHADYCHPDPEADCQGCDGSQAINRQKRPTTRPRVHYGVIASGNQVMKDACSRDKLAKDLGVLCFEMEAAGLMNHFPCLVIRGICDYADSHKNNQWQGYAAMAAAAYSKELLSNMPSVSENSFSPTHFDTARG